MREDTVPIQKLKKLCAAPNRRARQRFPCDLVVNCRLLRKRFACNLVGVINISTAGAALILSRALECGTILAIDIQRGSNVERTLLGRVVHATRRGPEAWAIGCEFASPLSEKELQNLLS
jgi:PilZ domain